MKKKKLLSLLLVSLLAVGVLGGCGTKDAGTSSNSTKIEVVKESAFDTVPENSLVPEFVIERNEKHDELMNDYKALYDDLILNKEVENIDEIKSKYGITATYESSAKELCDQNKEFYSGFSQYLVSGTVEQKKAMEYTNQMLLIAQNYLANTLMGENNEVPLAPELNDLNPYSYVKKYLKENNIEVTNVVYPQKWKNFHMGPASTIISADVVIEGSQNGKSFSETKRYNFHFTVSDDIREGGSPRYEDCLSLIAVTDNCFDEDQYNYYDANKLLELVK